MTAPEQPTPPNRQIEDRWAAKLWLWKNGDHHLAFDSECPTYDGGDPKTLGEPVGFALLERETYDRMTEQRAAEAVKAAEMMKGTTNYGNNAQDNRPNPATPPPGDAGERARDLLRFVFPLMRRAKNINQLDAVESMICHQVDAALQSERTAAESQARRDAFAECAAKIRNMHGGWPTGAGDSDEWTLDDVADALMRALATPQESA
jgi:hypothetical protein